MERIVEGVMVKIKRSGVLKNGIVGSVLCMRIDRDKF
jgi:hypothetical protein